MLKTFQKHIDRNHSFLKEKRLLIAVSGGLDSVVLTHLCCYLELDVALAHCNFNLRDTESDADETFVRQLAKQLGLKLHIKKFPIQELSKTHKGSLQMLARTLRYDWFKTLAQAAPYDFVLTAHHADDTLETMLINFLRGTGLEGLTGIPARNNQLVRPLLPFSREQLKQYALTQNICWREDSSNTSDKYLRNVLRHKVIPELKAINPDLLQRTQTTIQHLQGTSNLVKAQIEAFLERTLITISPTEKHYKIAEFKQLKTPEPYLFEIFKPFGFTQWQDILKLLDASSGKQVFSKHYRLIKDRDYLLLSLIDTCVDDVVLVQETDTCVRTATGTLCVTPTNAFQTPERSVIHVNKNMLTFPLVLRKKQQGDYFYPFGMLGKKRLSKYFKDEKLSLLEKENTWLLCSGANIIWVVGRRADRRFLSESEASDNLKITWMKS